MTQLDALIFAVSHDWYLRMGQDKLAAMVRDGGVLVDVKSALDPARIGRGVRYWSL
jgi:UDP-N-acetyl-D-galactosamine dehydrogenase